MREDSDIDILVEYDTIKPLLRERIINEQVIIL